MGALIASLAGIYVVGFLIKDVVDSVDQEVEGEGYPDQDRDDLPGP